MAARRLLFTFLTLGLLLILADHLMSPPIQAGGTTVDAEACAPCGAPCQGDG